MYLSINNLSRNQSKNVHHVTENANICPPPLLYSILNLGEGGILPSRGQKLVLRGDQKKS